jgi:phosphodiesterase/alkaline phosphatase D-like protein
LLLAVFILATLIPPARAEVVFAGIAAGDPSSTDAIVWTRAYNGGNTTSLRAHVATDQALPTSSRHLTAPPDRTAISP